MQLLERRPGQAPGVLGGTVSNGDKDLSTSDIYILYIDRYIMMFLV